MVGLNYTCSMPTNRHRTHDAVDRSFYDAITIRTSDHLLAGKRLQKGYSCSFFAKKNLITTKAQQSSIRDTIARYPLRDLT